LGVKVTQVYSKLGSLDNEIKVARNNVQENGDEILMRQREYAEQIQVEMQREKEIVEKRIEEFRSERVSKELIQGKGVVNPTSGVTESVRGIVTINETMNVPATTSCFLGTPGGMNTNVSMSHAPIN
jgi:predicted Holliday junction resolvase-like endonuclease